MTLYKRLSMASRGSMGFRNVLEVSMEPTFPSCHPADYYNHKGWRLIILQGSVDNKGRFIDIYVDWPGRVHDARVFANSTLFHATNSRWKQNTSLTGQKGSATLMFLLWCLLTRRTLNCYHGLWKHFQTMVTWRNPRSVSTTSLARHELW